MESSLESGLLYRNSLFISAARNGSSKVYPVVTSIPVFCDIFLKEDARLLSSAAIVFSRVSCLDCSESISAWDASPVASLALFLARASSTDSSFFLLKSS